MVWQGLRIEEHLMTTRLVAVVYRVTSDLTEEEVIDSINDALSVVEFDGQLFVNWVETTSDVEVK